MTTTSDIPFDIKDYIVRIFRYLLNSKCDLIHKDVKFIDIGSAVPKFSFSISHFKLCMNFSIGHPV